MNKLKLPKGVGIGSKTSLELRFTYQGEFCKERIKLMPTKPNIKRAERKLAVIMDEIERGTFDYAKTFPNSKKAAKLAKSQGDVILIKDYLELWCKRKEGYLKSSTVLNYWKIIKNKLVPQFGEKPLSQLKRSDVRDWCETLHVSNKTISNVLSPLRNALQDACDDELISENPLANWVYRNKAKPRGSSLDPFSADEQDRIINAINNPLHKNLVVFLFWTGLRTSELIALRWDDIDMQDRVALINKAKTDASDEPETPKTAASVRLIKLLPPAFDALLAQQELTGSHESGCVFVDDLNNKSWQGDQPIRKRVWIPALKRANVRYRYPYQTRHTFASMMVSSGENISWLSKQLGHSNAITTLRVYAKWIKDGDPNAGMKAVGRFAKVDKK